MNRAMFEQMMARLGSSSMLPPPNADYAPGGSMFPGGKVAAPVDPNNPSQAVPKGVFGAIAPETAAKMAAKGGGV
jgi:hypothetical protein